MAKLLRKSYEDYKAHFPKLIIFVGQNSILYHYYNQNAKDGIQIWVYKINNENVTHFSHFISVKVKKTLRKSQAQLREKLRNLRLRQTDDLTKNIFQVFPYYCQN